MDTRVGRRRSAPLHAGVYSCAWISWEHVGVLQLRQHEQPKQSQMIPFITSLHDRRKLDRDEWDGRERSRWRECEGGGRNNRTCVCVFKGVVKCYSKKGVSFLNQPHLVASQRRWYLTVRPGDTPGWTFRMSKRAELVERRVLAWRPLVRILASSMNLCKD